MNNKRIFLFFCTFFLLIFIQCVPSSVGDYSPDENIYGDFQLQYNEKDNTLKCEAQFYIANDQNKRPYFLDKPIYLNKVALEKKFFAQKGVYYHISSFPLKKREAVISFENLDGKRYNIEIPIHSFQWGNQFENISKSKPIEEKWLSPSSTLLCVDTQNKMRTYNQNTINDIREIKEGEVSLVHVFENDTTFQLDNKLWIKYSSKSVSKSKKVNILP